MECSQLGRTASIRRFKEMTSIKSPLLVRGAGFSFAVSEGGGEGALRAAGKEF